MSTPKRPDRWDGWDDPDYTPTQAELEEPPEDLAKAVMRPLKGPA